MDYLNEVRKNLDLSPTEKERVIQELETHYAATMAELRSSGMSDDEAAAETGRRLGDPADIARRMQTVHCCASWKTALLTALPFLGALLVPQVWLSVSWVDLYRVPGLHGTWMALAVAFTAMLSLGSLRELRCGRRPIWLATWLAVAIVMLVTWASYPWVFVGYMTASSQAPPRMELAVLLNSLLAVVIPCVLATWAWRSSKWTWLLMGLAIISLACLACDQWLLQPSRPMGVASLDLARWAWAVRATVAIRMLVQATLVMAIALGIFSRHRYGSAVQSSLFLYTICVFDVAVKSLPPGENAPVLTMLAVLMSGAVVILFGRAFTLFQKRFWLTLGIFLLFVRFIYLVDHLSLVALFVSLVLVPVLLLWVIYVPMLFERRRWHGKYPEIAR